MAHLLIAILLSTVVVETSRAQFAAPLTIAPQILQDGFGPSGDALLFGGLNYCCPTGIAMSLSTLGIDGFNQLAPSSASVASELNLVRVLSGLMNTDPINGTASDADILTGINLYLAASGIGTANYSLTTVASPTMSMLATLNQPGSMVNLGGGYYDSSGNRTGGHLVQLLTQGVNALGQAAPNTITINNPAPGAWTPNADIAANGVQYLNTVATSGNLTSDGALQLDPAQYPGFWGSTLVLETAYVLTVNPNQLSAQNPTPAAWTLSGTQTLNLNSGTLPVLAPLNGIGGLSVGAYGLLELEAADTTSGANTLNSGTLESTISSGIPFGTGSFTLKTGTLQLSPVAGTSSVSLATASGASKTFTFVHGGMVALDLDTHASMTFTLGGNTNGTTPNLVRSGTGTLVIAPGAGSANLGGSIRLQVKGSGSNLPPVTNGMASPAIVVQDNDGLATGDFVTYGTKGFTQAAYTLASTTPIATAGSTAIYSADVDVALAAGTTAQVYALKVAQVTVSGGSNSVLQVGPQTGGQAGIVLNGGTISTPVLAFGSAEGLIYTGGAGGTITSTIQGSGANGLTTFGPGALTLQGANTYTGVTNINSGTLQAQNTTGSATGTGAINVRTGGTLAISGTTAIAGSAASTTTVNAGAELLFSGGTLDGTLNAGALSYLFGTGTITGAATISGIIGNSGTPSQLASYQGVEDLTFTNDVTFTNSSIYSWKLNALDATPANAGIDWSLLNFTSGTANLGTNGNPLNFTLDLGAAVADPNSGNAFWYSPHQWLVASDSQGFNYIWWKTDFPTCSQGSFAGTNDSAFANVYVDYTPLPPTLVTAAAAVPAVVTGVATSLSVQATLPSGDFHLIYTWSTGAAPAGAVPPSFSDNGTNTASSTTVTFHQAGAYTLGVSIGVGGLPPLVSSVSVTVNQTLAAITVTPAIANLTAGQTLQLSSTCFDQFQVIMAAQPAFTWAVASGGGTVDSGGLYASPAGGTQSAVTASTGSISGTALVDVVSAPWISADVGSPTDAGQAFDLGGTFTVSGEGGDIGGASDQCHQVYQALGDAGVIVARVTTQQNTAAGAKAGVMIRTSGDPAAAFALMWISPGQGMAMRSRTSSGGSASDAGSMPVLTAPAWVKLEWAGGSITGSSSTDGVNWTVAGTVSLATGTGATIGLAVCSGDSAQLCTATFDHVAVVTALDDNLAVSPGAPATLGVLAYNSIPAGSTTVLQAVTQGAQGTVVNNGDGSLTYTAASTAVGDDSFSYTLADVQGNTASAIMHVSIHGLRARYGFEEGTGTTTADLTGDGATATLHGATWTTGVDNTEGLAFSGTATSYATIPALNLNSNTVTLTAWIYSPGTQATDTGLIFCRAGSTIAGLRLHTSGHLGFVWNNVSYNSTLTLPATKWTFVALVITPTGSTLYLQPQGGAKQSASSSATLAASPFDGVTTLGQDPGGGSFKGSMDEVRIYNTALTAAAIDAIASFIPITVTSSSASVASNISSLVIHGTGFDPRAGNNTVLFTPSGTGTVTSATPTSLTVTGLAGLTYGSNLYAVVTTNGYSSRTPEQVAAVVTPTAPVVAKPTSTRIASTVATLGGDVTGDGGASVTALGVVYSVTSANAIPQIGGTAVINVTGAGTAGVFTVNTTGLAPNVQYSFAAYATNSQGTTYSNPVLTFITPAIAPVVTTSAGNGLSFDGATLNGIVNAEGYARAVTFDYGLTTSYGSSATAAQSPLSGSIGTPVTAALASLLPHTKYNFRIRASGAAGSATGANMTFATLNRAPAATADIAVALPSAKVAIPVLANDSDPDGDVLTIYSFTQPGAAVGTVARVGTVLVFTPSTTFTGGSFSYIAADGFGGNSVATAVTLNLGACVCASSLSAASDQATSDFAVTASAPFTVTGKPTWLGFNPIFPGDTQVTFVFSPNPSVSSRTATIKVGGQTVIVTQSGITAAPVLTTPTTIPNAAISANYDLAIPTQNGPVTYTASGLPTGLTLSNVTGHITGMPTVAKIYSVSVSAKNAKGTSLPAITFPITVLAFPTSLVGGWSATMERDTAVNTSLGGLLSFTVAANGPVTGTLKSGAASYPFTGRLNTAADPAAPDPLHPRLTVAIPHTSLVLVLNLNSPNVGYVAGTVTLGSGVANLSGAQQVWSLAGHAIASDYAGSFTTALQPTIADASIPQGDGFLTFTVSTKGIITWSGQLADGTVLVTGSSALWPGGELPLFASLYMGKGSLLGTPVVTAVTRVLTGSLNWSKTAQPATVRAYGAGFGTLNPVSLTLLGGGYTPPAKSFAVLTNVMPPTGSAQITFVDGGIGSVAMATSLSQTLTISSANVATLPATNPGNPANIRISMINPTNGTFAGSLTLKDNNPFNAALPKVARVVSFNGVFLQGGNNIGTGCFLLPGIAGPPANVTTSPETSGQVLITP